MSKLLTICIPTRNRLISIQNNVDHLINLVETLNLSNEINIIVSDNSKNINNYLHKKNLTLHFFEYMHSFDYGHDFNIQKLINTANSKYIWLCQDHTKILFNNIKLIITKLKKNNLDYLFVSTKKNYYLEDLVSKNPKYLSFKNTYLNTNIVILDKFRDLYNLSMNSYNESHLVWHYSIIKLLFNNSNSKIDYLLGQCSIYKFFDINDEHKKMTWSLSLNNYIKILSLYTSMHVEFYNNKNINNIFIKKIFRINLHSIPTIYRLHQLNINNDTLSSLNIKYKNFINHPSFSNIDKFIINNIIFNKTFLAIFLKKFYIIEIYHFFFLPKLFLKKTLNRLTKFFYSSS